MRKFACSLIVTCFGVVALVNTAAAQTRASAAKTEVNFDEIFEWKKPCVLNSELLEARLDKLGPGPGKKCYALDKSPTFSQPSQLFNPTYSQANNQRYLVFGSKEFEPESVRVMWDKGQIAYVGIRYSAKDGESEAAPVLLASIGDALGAPTFSRNGKIYSWNGEHYTASASFSQSRDDTIFFVTVRPKNPSAPPVAYNPAGASDLAAVTINFDAVFEWKKPGALTRDLLASKIAPHEQAAGGRLYQPMKMEEGSEYWFSGQWSQPAPPKFSIFGSQLRPAHVRVLWLDGLADKVTVYFDAQKDEVFPPQLLSDMDSAFGAPHTLNTQLERFEWSWPGYTANARYSTAVGRGDPTFLISIKRQPQAGAAPSVAAVTAPAMPPPEKPSASEAAEIMIKLDDFVDWKTPVNLSVETFDAKLRTLENEAGGSLCRIETRPGEELRFFDPAKKVGAARVRYALLDGQYYPTYAFMHWKQGKLITIELAGMKTAAGQEIEPLQTMYRLDKMFGVSHVVEADYAYSWSVPGFRALLIKSPNVGYILRLEQPKDSSRVVATNMPPTGAPPAVGGTLKYTMDLDPLVNWNDPLGIEPSQIETIFANVIKETGHRLWTESENMTVMGWGNPDIKMTLMQGRLKIILSTIYWGASKSIFFRMLEKDLAPGDDEWLYNKLDEILKVSRVDRKPPNNTFVSFEWAAKNFIVRTSKKQGETLTLTILRPADFDPAGPSKPVAANLDFLLTFPSLWSAGADSLEKLFVVKNEKVTNTAVAPQFEWVSSSKDRARFSRHMFSNAETNLTMFGGSIKVEEAILEFVNGKAARATISFYNRGDSGDIDVKEFDRIFKVIGQNLSQVMKVAPKRQMMSSNAALPVTGWNWTSPMGIALLEYNEYNTPGKVTKPEFLRLKLASPTQADWSMGKMATGVQRMELVQRVKKTPEGDVYISGVPMVDQGQKGYCVAASCQRLFEYMRIPCDQHEMAKLVNIDAESGASIMTMQKSLAKIDGAFKVTFKPLINPELYYAANRKRRVSEKEFISIVKEYAEKGVPLLWGLTLGQVPEDPPLPGGGQVSGGHMRMVIGYNLAKNQVLFTDSWGAGHELKRMAMPDAYEVTMGLYSMAPRGF